MDPTFEAEELPELYRSILALVGELERADRRPEADRIRSRAIATYSSAWDERNRRQLRQLEGRLRDAVATRPGGRRPRWLRLP